MNLESAEVKELMLFAERLAETCRAVALEMYQLGSRVEIKADKSLVTETDKRIEEIVRETIGKVYPTHAVLGEEMGGVLRGRDYAWTVDPIDGTEHFVYGVPTFGFILALHVAGVPTVGVIDHPALNCCLVGGKGLGVRKNGEPVRIKNAADDQFSDEFNRPEFNRKEIFVLATRDIFQRTRSGTLFDRLVQIYPNHRIYYDVFGHTLGILGSVDMVFEVNARPWDIAATELLVQEAGGAFVWVGEADRLDPNSYSSAVFGKPHRVKQLLNLLGEGDFPRIVGTLTQR